MQPIVNMRSKRRRCCLKLGSTHVTIRARITVALLLATVMIVMPFSVEAFVAALDSNNDTHAIIREDRATNLPHRRYFTRPRYDRALTNVLSNQEAIVNKLDSLVRDVNFLKDLVSRKVQLESHGINVGREEMLMQEAKSRNREQERRKSVFSGIDEKLTKHYNTRTSQITYTESPRQQPVLVLKSNKKHDFPHPNQPSRNKRSAAYYQDAYLYQSPVYNNHATAFNLDSGFVENNHIDTTAQYSLDSIHSPRLGSVQPLTRSSPGYLTSYGTSPVLSAVYEDPHPMYGPLYDGGGQASYTNPHSGMPRASYQDSAVILDPILDNQRRNIQYVPNIQPAASHEPSVEPNFNLETEGNVPNDVRPETPSTEDARSSQALKSLVQELLSLVRWLVRKQHQSSSSQNNFIHNLKYALNQRLLTTEEEIKAAVSTQTEQLSEKILLGFEINDCRNVSYLIYETIANGTSLWEQNFAQMSSQAVNFKKNTSSIEGSDTIPKVSDDIVRVMLNDGSHHTYNYSVHPTPTYDLYSTHPYHSSSMHPHTSSNSLPYGVSAKVDDNEALTGSVHYNEGTQETTTHNSLEDILSFLDFSDYLSSPRIVSDPDSVIDLPLLVTSALPLDFNETKPNHEEHSQDPAVASNQTQTNNVILPREIQAAKILFIASQMFKDSLTTTGSSDDVQENHNNGNVSRCSPNRTEFLQPFTDDFRAFLEELKMRLGESVSQNINEDSLEGVLERSLRPSVTHLEDRILGLRIYLDAAMLKLRHEFEAAIGNSESAITAAIAATVANTATDALHEARNIALQIADASVTSVSSAAVATGHHTNDFVAAALKRSTAQIKTAIRQGTDGCPQHFTAIAGLCLKVPTIVPPVPLPPVHYDASFAPTSPVSPTTAYNWTQARALCRSYDGDLAVLPATEDVNKVVRSLHAHSRQGFWLGAKTSIRSSDADTNESRVKLKWITGEYSGYKGGLQFSNSLLASSSAMQQNEIGPNHGDFVNDNFSEVQTESPDQEKRKCLLLRLDDGYGLEAMDCGALYRPLCQYIPTL
ncbi:uncharacterized protein LOC108679621 [Hyalella azteca]|uniref:Uncharacterized protein LOC108679621 n=1 Tax=Hyalella azteca TaxID=294128 RepID=A0A8B7PC78_HYAAZ|nr:uncharacterized protein LOC108679621 [Hyalella azteca]